MTQEIVTGYAEEVGVLDLDLDLARHLGEKLSVMYLITEQVKVELCEDSDVAEIFEWQIAHTREHGEPARGKVLVEEFPGYENYAPETQIGDLVARLRERYIRNQARKQIRQLAEIATDDPLSLSKELMLYGRKLADLTAKRGEVFGLEDFHRAMDHYREKAARGMGPSLGFKELDDHFHGMLGVTFLLAPPKTYKSWLAVNAVKENVLRGTSSYLYSLELPAVESYWRLGCMAADVPYWKYLKNCIPPWEEDNIRHAIERMREEGIARIEKPQPGERSVTRMVERAINAGADCVYIDQLQYVENDKGQSLGAMNNTGDYFDAVNLMRNYSDQIPIFVVHQFNRSVMNSTGMPEMQQGKGSSAIEEVATLSLGVWANKEMRHENEVEIGTLASRNYNYASWRVGVNLSSGCSMKLKYRVGEDDE